MNDPSAILQRTFDSFTSKLKAANSKCLPVARYIATGEVAYDCDQFVVQASSIYQGQPGRGTIGYQVATGGIAQYAFDINVMLVRNVPVMDDIGSTPTTKHLTSAALQAGADAKSLTDAFFAAMADNSIMGTCDTVYFNGVTWNGPRGGMLGTILGMAVQL